MILNILEKVTTSIKVANFRECTDDYLDCFGNPDDLGKIGTDIQENKCTWLICKALEVCNDEEKGVLEKHYGKDNEFDIQQIKKMYSHLKIDVIYGKKSSIMYKELKAEIIELGIYFPPQLFLNYLELIHNRQK
ncbi:hypothetical protein A3Q56_07069 [Intoshia linei]|uniref:Farnesyl pyrophosphate synthase n=1 Tax=Intoshia linei TaxID=1819745 RepID=A0A177AT07_9BILA|nr:hypothetical protein A3Q56_07069 [Intoshia linei]